MNKRLTTLIFLSIAYCVLIQTKIAYFIAAPIDLLVTFLHEFSHAAICILTGGKVESLEININGSGVTTIIGGYPPLIIMGGYIGSCFFSNLLIRYSHKYNKLISNIISISTLFASIFWFDNNITTIILISYSIIFFIIGRFLLSEIILQFIGVACVIDVLEDFDIGPCSDLKEFTQTVGIFSQNTWMYIWLFICIVVTIVNMQQILRKN